MNINVSPYIKSVVVDDNTNFNDILICWVFLKDKYLNRKNISQGPKN